MTKRVEKRAYDRVDLRDVYVPVMCRDEDQTDIKGQVLDISQGGMFIMAEVKEKVGKHMSAYIDCESIVKVVWAHGRVVRESPDGIGVTFTDADQKGITDIMDLCRKKL